MFPSMMPKPLRMTHCLLVALAVVASGCGSTETASTSTKSASGSTPNQPSTQTASQSTGSTQAQHTTGTTREPKAAETKPKRQEKAAEAKRQAAQKASKERTEAVKVLEAAGAQVPLKKQYSAQEQIKFMFSCNRTAKSPHLTCECVLVKQELRKIETGQSLAELLALNFALSRGVSLHRAVHEGVPFPGASSSKRRVRLPHEILLSVEECESASK
jgi:hypothetical protein